MAETQWRGARRVSNGTVPAVPLIFPFTVIASPTPQTIDLTQYVTVKQMGGIQGVYINANGSGDGLLLTTSMGHQVACNNNSAVTSDLYLTEDFLITVQSLLNVNASFTVIFTNFQVQALNVTP